MITRYRRDRLDQADKEWLEAESWLGALPALITAAVLVWLIALAFADFATGVDSLHAFVAKLASVR